MVRRDDLPEAIPPTRSRRRRISVGDFTLTVDFYDRADYKMSRHAHEQCFLHFVLHGNFSETCRNVERLVDPGTLVLHPAGEPHANHFHDCPRVLRIAVPKGYREALDGVRGFDAPVYLRPGSRATWLGQQLQQECNVAEGFALLSIESLLFELLAEIDRYPEEAFTSRRPPAWLRRSRDLIHDRFAQGLSLAEIAAPAGVHPIHLARAFRQHFSCSVGDYARHLRLDHARRLLVTSCLPLTEVALEAGFTDQSHLTRALKQASGLTPAAFRRRHAW